MAAVPEKKNKIKSLGRGRTRAEIFTKPFTVYRDLVMAHLALEFLVWFDEIKILPQAEPCLILQLAVRYLMIASAHLDISILAPSLYESDQRSEGKLHSKSCLLAALLCRCSHRKNSINQKCKPKSQHSIYFDPNFRAGRSSKRFLYRQLLVDKSARGIHKFYGPTHSLNSRLRTFSREQDCFSLLRDLLCADPIQPRPSAYHGVDQWEPEEKEP